MRCCLACKQDSHDLRYVNECACVFIQFFLRALRAIEVTTPGAISIQYRIDIVRRGEAINYSPKKKREKRDTFFSLPFFSDITMPSCARVFKWREATDASTLQHLQSHIAFCASLQPQSSYTKESLLNSPSAFNKFAISAE